MTETKQKDEGLTDNEKLAIKVTLVTLIFHGIVATLNVMTYPQFSIASSMASVVIWLFTIKFLRMLKKKDKDHREMVRAALVFGRSMFLTGLIAGVFAILTYLFTKNPLAFLLFQHAWFCFFFGISMMILCDARDIYLQKKNRDAFGNSISAIIIIVMAFLSFL